MMLRNKVVVLLAFGLGRALGALYEGPTDEVLKRSYDVIVVGGWCDRSGCIEFGLTSGLRVPRWCGWRRRCLSTV